MGSGEYREWMGSGVRRVRALNHACMDFSTDTRTFVRTSAWACVAHDSNIIIVNLYTRAHKNTTAHTYTQTQSDI